MRPSIVQPIKLNYYNEQKIHFFNTEKKFLIIQTINIQT